MIMSTPGRRDGGDDSGGCFKAWFALCAVIALVVLSVGLWAVIKVVTHFTA